MHSCLTDFLFFLTIPSSLTFRIRIRIRIFIPAPTPTPTHPPAYLSFWPCYWALFY
ncbi:hypothetical protein PHYBLDRAFT_153632 [Phycomyces blakesleeanus NRRL 1555(-)]|uniref:Uncharacterized protein n=1 Tax=Phycomyces blakesleeanus (strain ATCC 8743b / DSM 1359 / FGSC 10004 / NBRC 33097 / NRRL 1555) TaxID=763407 RepID=A0A162PFM5_PHYB8|nr:hypothetical protein PHYBLDRAFT_153632 [Phycomyces blakesleeanus NRRL 1555(-)]OAD65246.1 hypothetical protein PHYBLDRAFT_153632 [Phycomyces blakesleeanus NRRL 1555(-)]|eukprot:XP_018283286.1 hypothetical protein PHYBLDRAFT_153632 [Phycomyces blakesleeanus NRRL 1555(-)]